MTAAHWLLIAIIPIKITYAIAIAQSLLFLLGYVSVSFVIPLCALAAWCLDEHITYLFIKYNITDVEQLL